MQACVGRLKTAADVARAAAASGGGTPLTGASPIQLVAEMHGKLLMCGEDGGGSGDRRAAQQQRAGLERLMACLLGMGGDASATVSLRELHGRRG